MTTHHAIETECGPGCVACDAEHNPDPQEHDDGYWLRAGVIGVAGALVVGPVLVVVGVTFDEAWPPLTAIWFAAAAWFTIRRLPDVN